MTFAHNLLRTLVEKRLWPVAVALLVAIVAIPVIGGGGGAGESAEQAALPSAPTNAVSGKPPVDLVGPASVRKRAGRIVDPFRRGATKDDSATPEIAPSGVGVGVGAGAGVTAGDATTPPPGDTTAPSVDSEPPPPTSTSTPESTQSVYRTTVRWSSDAPPKARRIARLTPLGGLIDPALLYLGIAPDGRHMLFLLGPNATSSGEAGCPDADCRIISLARGETQIVDLQPAGAEPSQFELELVSVRRDELSSVAAAARARAREHSDGRDVLRSLLEHAPTAEIMDKYAYDTDQGVMVLAGGEPAKDGE